MDIEATIKYLISEGHMTQEDFDQKVKDYEYILNNPIFDYSNLSLEEAKEVKIKELSYNCQQDIIYGFTASNGNSYRLKIEDQLNMQGQKASLDDDTTIISIDWMTIDDVQVTHTRDEWLTVYQEAFQHKQSCIFKNKQLRDQVKLAKTKAELDEIHW